MADEIKRVIQVDVSEAVSHLEEMRDASEEAGYGFRSLGEAKKYIDKLKASLIDMDEESEVYVDTVKEIETVQNKLNTAMKASSSTLSAAEGSYNALSKQMSELKKAWKETSDEAERDALGKQIVEINDKLKSFDSSIGNYQRNVGNYTEAFKSGFKDMAEGLDNIVPGIKKSNKAFGELGGAMKAFAANPVGAVIALIVTAFFALKKAIESNKAATESIKNAMKSFEPILNMVSNAIGFLADKIALVVSWLGTKLTGAIEWVVNKGLNKLVNGVITGINMMSKPLRTFYSWVIGAIEGIVKAAAKVGEITGLFNIDGAVAALDNARIAVRDFEVANVDLGLSFEKLSAKQEEETETTKKGTGAKKEATDAVKEHIKELEKEKNVISERIKAAQKDSEEYFALLKELENKEWEIQEARLKDEGYTDDQIEVYRQNHLKRLSEIGVKAADDNSKEIVKIQERLSTALLGDKDKDLANLKKKYDEERELLKDHKDDLIALEEEYNRNVANITAKYEEKRLKDIDSNAALETLITDKTVNNEFDKRSKILDINLQRLNDQKTIYEGLLELDNLSEEQKEEYKNKLAEIDAEIAANSYERTQLEKEHISSVINTYAQMTQSIGQLMSEISGIWEDSINERLKNGKITEEQAKKEFESNKKMQIASAVINGLAGVAMAIATAMQLGPIAGPIMGAINAAVVAASTAAQIVKIKQTTFGGSGSVSSSTPTAASPSSTATAYTPNYSTNVTGQSETTDLANAVKEGQKDQRVFVVESDITETGKRVQVRESEATF